MRYWICLNYFTDLIGPIKEGFPVLCLKFNLLVMLRAFHKISLSISVSPVVLPDSVGAVSVEEIIVISVVGSVGVDKKLVV